MDASIQAAEHSWKVEQAVSFVEAPMLCVESYRFVCV